ncbi:WXG100 family type VII secretion target [Cryptosporangium phraense]|uniref:Outer membrane channel protein CpnT-like N-terminal domain-containing protein n=1 Tax=Cryptosporangium phraense TaxID=2593070 RepID=A0A545AR47_9ACTN|nr:WXG100 family type VII secretion target [Cryptosporangium phraense]TQS43810.1 hypothetical protein FL583_17450 [Cryptosporangium phraense]
MGDNYYGYTWEPGSVRVAENDTYIPEGRYPTPRATDWGDTDNIAHIRALWPMIAGLDPEKIAKLAQSWRTLSTQLTAAKNGLSRHGGKLAPEWTGEAASAFLERVGGSLYSLDQWIEAATKNAATIDRLASDIRTTKPKVEKLYKDWLAESKTEKAKRDADKKSFIQPNDKDDWIGFLGKHHIIPGSLGDKAYAATRDSISQEEIDQKYTRQALPLVQGLANHFTGAASTGVSLPGKFKGPTTFRTVDPGSLGPKPSAPGAGPGAPPPVPGGAVPAAPPPVAAAAPPAPPPVTKPGTPPAKPPIQLAGAPPAPPPAVLPAPTPVLPPGTPPVAPGPLPLPPPSAGRTLPTRPTLTPPGAPGKGGPGKAGGPARPTQPTLPGRTAGRGGGGPNPPNTPRLPGSPQAKGGRGAGPAKPTLPGRTGAPGTPNSGRGAPGRPGAGNGARPGLDGRKGRLGQPEAPGHGAPGRGAPGRGAPGRPGAGQPRLPGRTGAPPTRRTPGVTEPPEFRRSTPSTLPEMDEPHVRPPAKPSLGGRRQPGGPTSNEPLSGDRKRTVRPELTGRAGREGAHKVDTRPAVDAHRARPDTVAEAEEMFAPVESAPAVIERSDAPVAQHPGPALGRS